MNIYRLYNRGSGKSYVGATKKALARRLHNYRHDAARSPQSTNAILADINTYGAQNVEITLLERIRNPFEVYARVAYWINHLETREPKGYNEVREPQP